MKCELCYEEIGEDEDYRDCGEFAFCLACSESHEEERRARDEAYLASDEYQAQCLRDARADQEDWAAELAFEARFGADF